MRTRRWILEISSWGTTTARSLCDFAQHAGQEDGTVPVPEHCFYLWRNSGCHVFRLFQEPFLHCTCSFSRTFCHFFDGTASVPRFSDCMLVQINCFCRHVLPTPCIRKNDFPLSHCSTGCCVCTCQLYSKAGALRAPALLKLLKYSTNMIFFFDFTVTAIPRF